MVRGAFVRVTGELLHDVQRSDTNDEDLPFQVLVQEVNLIRITRQHAGSHRSAVHANRLSVDPSPFGAEQKSDDTRDVFRFAQALERVELGQAIYLVWRFSVKKKLRPNRAGRNGIDGDLSATQLLRQYGGQHLDSGLRHAVGGIAGETERCCAR